MPKNPNELSFTALIERLLPLTILALFGYLLTTTGEYALEHAESKQKLSILEHRISALDQIASPERSAQGFVDHQHLMNLLASDKTKHRKLSDHEMRLRSIEDWRRRKHNNQ